MTDFWRKVGAESAKRTNQVYAGIVVITALLAIGLFQLEFATGQDSFLNSDSRIAQDNEEYQDLFGGENMVVLFTAADGATIADLFTPSNLAQFEEIEADLRASDDTLAVISPVTALQWTENLVTSGVASRVLEGAIAREPDPAAVPLRQQSALITTLRAVQAGAPSFENPAWVQFLLFENVGFELSAEGELVAPAEEDLVIRRSLRGFIPNAENALLGVVLPGNAPLSQLADGEALVNDAFEGRTFENADVIITGTPTFLNDINDYLQGGMLTLGAIAVAVMAIVLLTVFQVRWRLLPLPIVLIGVIWAFSVVGLLGMDLSLVTISGLPILIGIGIDFAIQIHSRVEQECVEDNDPNPMRETALRIAPWLLVATVAAALAFLVMQISQVPMIRDFGLLLAIGIIVLLVVGVVATFASLGFRERRKPTTEKFQPGWIQHFVVWLGALPPWSVLPLILLAIVVPIAGVAVEGDLDIESDPINWADQDTDTIRAARQFEESTGFATTMGVFIETDGAETNGIFTDELAAFVHDFALNEVEDQPAIAEASSLVTTVSYLLAVPGATAIPPTGQDILDAYEQAPEDIKSLLVGRNGNTAQINFRVGPSPLDERAEMIDELEASIVAPGNDRSALPSDATAAPAGLAVVGAGLLENITANRAALTYVALMVVAIWLLIRLRSLPRALLALVPVTIAVGLSSVLVAVLGITLSPLTTVSGPLVIATCAEFTILLQARYEEERDKGSPPREATNTASSRTGRAFLTSALTTLGGFGVLIFSPLPLLADFGAIVTLNIALALLSALVVLPPVMVWADERQLLRTTNTGPQRVAGGPAVAAASGVVLVVASLFLIVDAVSTDDDALAITQTVEPGEPVLVASGPPPAPPTEAPVEDTTPPPDDTEAPDDTEPAAELPDGPTERPDGLVAGGIYDAYLAAGAEPVLARCTADALLEAFSEVELIGMGIASTPPAEEAAAAVAAAAESCDVPQEVRDRVAAG